jgi:hypothetical protein
MADQAGRIERRAALFQGIEIIGEAREAPSVAAEQIER